jgi:GxxExxY protein
MQEFLYKDECYSIIGSAMEVHKQLGYGFLESDYQEALANEFVSSSVPFEKEKILEIEYKGITLKKKFIADFVCFDSIIVELKAVDALNDEHISQVISYLRATNLRLGFLINFGAGKLQYKRVIL